ncbi:hypothetical protein A2J03_21840 [Rhodococcus sp. EPR-157]|nr:hypothetical protein A2J03_21840 [Rhodococcus sp. EPR-157]
MLMNDNRRRTFETGSGGMEVVSPLVRAVLSYAPCDEREPMLPTEWIELSDEGAGPADAESSVRMRLSCAPQLGRGVPGPFGSMFYAGDHFEVIVPRRTAEQGALLMINLLDASAPTRFEFDTELPAGWSFRVERDGSVSIVDDHELSRIFIGATWAIDSRSARVGTRYTCERGKLVQNIDVGVGTSFPVLVDPDPDAIFTPDGYLVTATWEPRLIPGETDIAVGEA